MILSHTFTLTLFLTQISVIINIIYRAVHFNLWFSELLWNFPHLGSRSAQLAVLKFLAIPSELWHEINRPDPAVHTDSETPRPSMMARDSSSTIKTPTRSPGLSLLSSRALVSGKYWNLTFYL